MRVGPTPSANRRHGYLFLELIVYYVGFEVMSFFIATHPMVVRYGCCEIEAELLHVGVVQGPETWLPICIACKGTCNPKP